jgi:predicted metal-dependent HD superfamily phosphohydrolase
MDPNTLAQLYYAYRRPGRYYHTLDHISDCFKELKQALAAGVHVDDEEALRFAIWFHDYVYETNPPAANEELSAEAAYEAAIRLGHSEEFAQKVKRLIIVTKHDPINHPPMTNDEKLILDIDLATLAVDDFAGNTALVRLEYAHVPDAMFKPGRRAILAGFLNRPSIYNLDYFKNKYEAKARTNLIEATT